MGRIEDKHRKRKEHDMPDGKIGDRNEKNEDFEDLKDKTIKDKESKK